MKILANAIVATGMIGVAVLLKKLVQWRRGAHAAPTDETGFGRFVGHDEPGYQALAQLDDDLRAIATVERDVAAHQKI